MSVVAGVTEKSGPRVVNIISSVERFRSIDGLRGFACLLVVTHHCYLFGGRYQWPAIGVASWHFVLPQLLFHGYSGVELFFIISGFCLSYPVLSNPNREFDVKRYAKSRFKRI